MDNTLCVALHSIRQIRSLLVTAPGGLTNFELQHIKTAPPKDH